MGVEGESWVNPLTQEIHDKKFFSGMLLNKVLKICGKMISADVKS